MLPFSSKDIVVCSIVRDAENGLRTNIPVIKDLVRKFKNYAIVIYENDSKDKTKSILREWQEEDKEHLHLYMEDYTKEKTIPSDSSVNCNPFFSKKRISKMAFLRNKYMEVIDQLNLNADYLMVVDLDVAQLFLPAILSSFESPNDWDAVTAFGYSTSPRLKKRYHDTYALTEFGDEMKPQTEAKIKALADKYGSLKPDDNWVRVYSAFGGLAIYKFEAIKGLRYQLLDNDDERVEVKCEHYSIYKQMFENGYDKVFINPSMILKYQDLTWKIAFNSIRRKFKI